MYPVQTGQQFLVQQVISGTGVFDGSEFGRAKSHLGSSNSEVFFSARLYGTAPNAYTVAFVDAGTGVVVATTTATLVGSALSVSLRRSSGALLATSSEVAAAINALNVGVCAIAGGTGNGVVVAAGPTAITLDASGTNPTIGGVNSEKFLWYPVANTSGGFFYFEQQGIVVIKQFEAQFVVASGTHTMTVSRANLDSNLGVVSGETVPLVTYAALTSAAPSIAYAEPGWELTSGQALLVQTSTPLAGIVRMDVRKAAQFPYA